jgi:hypothetical protein
MPFLPQRTPYGKVFAYLNYNYQPTVRGQMSMHLSDGE